MQAIILTTIMMVVYTKLPLCDLSDEISMSARQDYSVMSLPFGFIFVIMILIDKFNFKWFKWQLPLFLPIVFTTYLYCSSSQSSPLEQLNSALYIIVVVFPWMMYDKGRQRPTKAGLSRCLCYYFHKHGVPIDVFQCYKSGC